MTSLKRRTGVTLLAKLFTFGGIILALTPAIAQTPNGRGLICSGLGVVGRVISSANLSLTGRLVCKGEIVPADSQVLCFDTGRIHSLQQGQAVSQSAGCNAPPRQAQPLRRCSPGDSYLCIRPKGEGATAGSLQILSPNGHVFRSPIPVLKWTSTGAQRYRVKVEGVGVKWQQESTEPFVRMPQNLSPGNTYRVVIGAYDAQDNLVQSKSTVITILSFQRVQELDNKLSKVKQLQGISLDEKFSLDILSLYLSYGLVDDSINLLSSRIQAGTQDPRIYRMLGDIYATYGQTRLAIEQYRKAISLAKTQSDTESLTLAQLGLERASRN